MFAWGSDVPPNAAGASGLPAGSPPGEFVAHQRPIVQCCRIEIGTIRPGNGTDFRIQPNLLEQIRIAKWAVEFPMKHWLKINDLLGSIVETHTESVAGQDLKSDDCAQQVSHCKYSTG